MRGISRRNLLAVLGGGGLVGGGAGWYYAGPFESGWRADLFVAKAESYSGSLAKIIGAGLRELGWASDQVKGKKVLLKPNLVEPDHSHSHINTHPLIVQAAEMFLRLGAATVTVAEGAGHVQDAMLVLEESGLGEVLLKDGISFVDLNTDDYYSVPNEGRLTRLKNLTLPVTLKTADLVVSMPKLKTHHWAGVTLSMKNLFGVMPGIVYGWPKNILHQEGIPKSILDICATVKPQLAIVDGVTGMEGDGPIMGTPRHAGVIVMGAHLPAVDATRARLMGVNPAMIGYLRTASGWLGPIRDAHIAQRGEQPRLLRRDFELLDKIPAHRGIRLA